MIATDETNITEIELLLDGRICVFGTSLEVLDVLDELQGGSDARIQKRVARDSNRQPPALPGVRAMLQKENMSASKPPAEPGADIVRHWHLAEGI